MMTPIINPWWFYAIDVCNHLDLTLTILTVVLCFMCLFIVCLILDEEVCIGLKNAKKVLKFMIPITILVSLLSLFTPTADTLAKMLIAQNVTYERVEVATDTVEQVYEEIMSLFEEDKAEE